MLDPPFKADRRTYNTLDLSTPTATSSRALLSNIRAERAAREERKRQDAAARQIQRVWRGRKEAAAAFGQVEQEAGGHTVEIMGRRLVVLLRRSKRYGSLEDWARRGSEMDGEPSTPLSLSPSYSCLTLRGLIDGHRSRQLAECQP